MKNYVERAWDKGKVRRPTQWAPNGCGPRATGPVDFVPDRILGVEFGSECCDAHDLEYYKGGFLGLFWRKPKADLGLGACLAAQMFQGARKQWIHGSVGRKFLAAAQAATAIPTAAVYTLFVTAFGWTPFTWRWYQRTPPDSDLLRELRAAVTATPAGPRPPG